MAKPDADWMVNVVVSPRNSYLNSVVYPADDDKLDTSGPNQNSVRKSDDTSRDLLVRN